MHLRLILFIRSYRVSVKHTPVHLPTVQCILSTLSLICERLSPRLVVISFTWISPHPPRNYVKYFFKSRVFSIFTVSRFTVFPFVFYLLSHTIYSCHCHIALCLLPNALLWFYTFPPPTYCTMINFSFLAMLFTPSMLLHM